MAVQQSPGSAAESLARSFVQAGASERCNVAKIFQLLEVDSPNPRGRDSGDSKTFISGALVHGGITSVMNNVSCFPWCTRLFTGFVRKHATAGVRFSTVAVFQNVQTTPHVDAHNCPDSINHVFQISDFEGGRVILQDPNGKIQLEHQGKILQGSPLEFRDHQARFCAKDRLHWTESWSGGPRIVLIAYTVRSLAKLSSEQAKALTDVGFNLPCVAMAQPAMPSPASPSGGLAVGQQPVALELFAGTGSLSKALRAVGFQTFAIDHHVAQATVPILKVDLVTEEGQGLVWQLLQSDLVYYVHLGVPCGTSSRARDKPLLPGLGPSPQPLRSAEHPLGLPSLQPGTVSHARVQSANALYRFAFKVLMWCAERHILTSLENPSRAYTWNVLELFAAEHPKHQSLWQSLGAIEFHSCMHGGRRKKKTRLQATEGLFDALALSCDNSHSHEPWSVSVEGSKRVFATSSEAAYPTLLAERMAACVKSALEVRHALRLQPPSRLHDMAAGAAQKQSRRHAPLIPEYRTVQTLPAPSPLPRNGKLLSLSQVQGVVAAEGPFAANSVVSASAASDSCAGSSVASASAASERRETIDVAVSGNRQVVGLWHTPEEHFQKALSLVHPVDSFKPVAMVTKRAVDYVLGTPPEVQNLDRKIFLTKLKIRAAELRQKESDLRKTMAPHLRKVLGAKNLLLWKELLEQSNFDDMGVCSFMCEGVKVVGREPHPRAYKSKLVPASISEEELRESALQRRRALELLCARGVSPEQRSQLMQATLEERDAGYLEGPYSASEVDDLFGHSRWNAIRRFVLVQDGGNKLRPIDDALEGQLNAACCTSIQLELQDADYVTSQALFVARRIAESNGVRVKGPWMGKCLDLSKAYKQVGVHNDHRDLTVILVPKADGSPTYFVSNSLIFGSVAAVYSFNRISKSLWHLINHFMRIPTAVYFDDYPMLMPEILADQADADVSEFLSILGWSHAVTGKKGQPFMPKFDVLGMTLDVSALHQGNVTLANKVGRTERILQQLKEVQEGSGPFRHSLQVLTGLLNFASGFYAGRELRHVCREFNQMLNQDRGSLEARLDELVTQTKECLKATPPRVLSCNAVRAPILVWTDGAWEANVATIGAVIYDTSTKAARVMGQQVDEEIVRSWVKPSACELEREQIISQVELFAMVCCRETFKRDWVHRRVLFFVDNESARFSAIKGGSVSPTMHDLVRLWDGPNKEWPALLWVERVPSFSNLADGPSRNDFDQALKLSGAAIAENFPCPENIRQSLCCKRRM